MHLATVPQMSINGQVIVILLLAYHQNDTKNEFPQSGGVRKLIGKVCIRTQGVCTYCLFTTWKCVPLVDLFNGLLWAGRNGL